MLKFVYGPGLDEPVCMICSWATFYYHYDGLGSVVGLSDEDGYLKDYYAYDVFGQPTRYYVHYPTHTLVGYNLGSGILHPFFFTGREYDHDNGLYYYRFRFYHPTLGRFMQPDPIGYYDSMNLYAYCFNDPVNWGDPYGLSWAWWDNFVYGAADAYCTVYDGVASVPGRLAARYYEIDPTPANIGALSGAFGDAFHNAGRGAANAFAGGLFDPEAGLLYQEGDKDCEEFMSGTNGARVAEGFLLAAGVCEATGFNPWLGSAAIHGAHAGGPHQFPHLQIMIRVGAHVTKHIRLPLFWPF